MDNTEGSERYAQFDPNTAPLTHSQQQMQPYAPQQAPPYQQYGQPQYVPSQNGYYPAPQQGYYPAPVQQVTVVGSGGSQTPHTLHLILTICTFGLWLPVWIIDALIRGRR